MGVCCTTARDLREQFGTISTRVGGECQSVGDESACAQGGRGFPPRSGLPGGRSTSSIIGRAHAWVMK